MFIMTENGYRPLTNFAPVWAARRERIEQERARVAIAMQQSSMGPNLDDMDRASLNRMQNYAWNRLSDAHDALIGYRK